MIEHEKVLLKVKRARENGLPIPAYKTGGAACFDLSADLDGGDMIVPGGMRVWVRTGWRFEIPPGFEMQVRGRSGLARTGLLVHHFGTIDCDYRGEVLVGLENVTDGPFVITHGARIAQAKIERVEPVSIIEVDEISETKRGTNGFGSTGSEP